ncbi:MAG: oligosaccharide flippase family protein [Pseudomonadota bacterium]|nr:oligosaccharide flippase family protein [Pseudomonadota bacterium]
MLAADLKKALLHSLLGKYVLYIIQLVSMMVLARLIAPEIFGVVAAVSVIAMFFQMIGVSGLTPAIVYQEKVDATLRNSIFTFTLLIGLVLAALFTVSAPYLHAWFGFTQGLTLFYLLGICSFFAALAIMPMSSLLKDSKFIRISQAEALAELIGFGLCLFILWKWDHELAALGGRFLAIPVFRFVFYYVFSKNTEIGRPAFGRDLKSVLPLYSYAKFQIMFNVVNYMSRNLDNLLIAKYFGAASLGIYEKTHQIMRYPLQLFTFAITPALQPVLTKYKHDPDAVCGSFFKVATRLAAVGVFSSVVLYLCTEEVIYILFGENWMQVAPLLKILALSIPVQMVMSSTGGVFQAFGKVKEMFYCGLFSSVTTVAAICYGVYSENLEILCLSIVVSFYINYVQCMWMLRKSIFSNHLEGFLLVTFILIFAFAGLIIPDATDLPENLLQGILQIIYVAGPAAVVTAAVLYGLMKARR